MLLSIPFPTSSLNWNSSLQTNFFYVDNNNKNNTTKNIFPVKLLKIKLALYLTESRIKAPRGVCFIFNRKPVKRFSVVPLPVRKGGGDDWSLWVIFFAIFIWCLNKSHRHHKFKDIDLNQKFLFSITCLGHTEFDFNCPLVMVNQIVVLVMVTNCKCWQNLQSVMSLLQSVA